MNLLVLEWCCSGLGGDPASLPGSLVREGLAMLRGVLESLRSTRDIQAKTILHPHLSRQLSPDLQVPHNFEIRYFEIPWAQLAQSFETLWPIAPETDRILLDLVSHTRPLFGNLLAPGTSLIEMATDKKKTFEHLNAKGLPTPETISPGEIPRTHLGQVSHAPWVLKRRDGAGSQDMRLLEHPSEAADLNANEWILQPLVSGKPVSQAILGGPKGCWFCPPCFQTISSDGAFTYQGGETPIPPDLAYRTRILAERLVATLPSWQGWLGVDMILGERGEHDRILEINPRLTTSFIGLDHAAGGNLAATIVRHALGLETAPPQFSPTRVVFDASGKLTSS